MADAESEADCPPFMLSCQVARGTGRVIGGASDAAEGAVESAANSALESFVNAMFEFALWILEIISTWWLNTPVADVEGGAVLQIQQDIQWYVMGFAIIGFLIGLIRMVTSQDIRQGLQTSFKPIVNLVLVTGVYATGVTMLLQAGDEGSAWLLERATEGEADLSEMFAPAAATGGAAALLPMLLVYVLAGLGGIVNFVFMIFRNLLLVVLMAFMPALAAATGTQRGDQAFGKANGWLIALLLFKPVAAGIYALGFRFMRNDTEVEGLAGELQSAVDQLTGAGIILLAALALPALIKFLVPAAATGAGAFSGGAAVGAGVGIAAGAAVLAGTGGGAAAGGAATATGGGGGSAGGSAAGASGTSGASGAAGSGSAGLPPGASGGGGDNGGAAAAGGGANAGGGAAAGGASSQSSGAGNSGGPPSSGASGGGLPSGSSGSESNSSDIPTSGASTEGSGQSGGGDKGGDSGGTAASGATNTAGAGGDSSGEGGGSAAEGSGSQSGTAAAGSGQHSIGEATHAGQQAHGATAGGSQSGGSLDEAVNDEDQEGSS